MSTERILAPQAAGWMNGRDPRLRVAAVLAFALVTVSLSRVESSLAAFAAAAILARASGLRPGFLARRLLALEGFMVILLASLPFTVPGETLASFGALTASREGLVMALTVILKANTVVLVVLALVGGMEPVTFGHTLARIGVPQKLVHLLLMTVRQIHMLHQEFLRLRQAMRARAFVPRSDRHTWRAYAYLIGMLMVRSLERSQRVLAAMRCRGFQGRLYLLDAPRWRPADTALAVLFVALLAMLPALDRLP